MSTATTQPTTTSLVVPIPLDLIDVPDEWREIEATDVSNLADSMRELGLLQAIGVYPRDDGRYTLVFGRQRTMAAALLGWDTINANLLDLGLEDDRQAATTVENLLRTELNASEKVRANKRLTDWYRERHPETVKPGRGAEVINARKAAEINGTVAAEDHAPEAERPDQYAARVTGQDETTIRHHVRIAKVLGDDALAALNRRNVTMTDLKALVKIKDPKIREHATKLAVAGYPVSESIAEATNPGSTAEVGCDNSVPDETPPNAVPEEELSDEQWLDVYCTDVIKRLKNPDHYKKDALLYRHTREARETFKNTTKKAMNQGKTFRGGPFHRILANLVNIDHPSGWLACGKCEGRGLIGSIGECGSCHGHGYHATPARYRKGERKGDAS